LLDEGLVFCHGWHVLGDDDFDKGLGVMNMDGSPISGPRNDVSVAIPFHGIEKLMKEEWKWTLQHETRRSEPELLQKSNNQQHDLRTFP
jgi:hypothetical protein